MSKIIVVDGLPGVGKTFFCNKLRTSITRDMTAPFLPYSGFSILNAENSDEEEINPLVKVFPEEVDRVLLDKYLKDPKQYAFEFQKKILHDKARIYERAQTVKDCGGIAIIDRSIEGDRAMAMSCYARGLITPLDWDDYSLEYSRIMENFRKQEIKHDLGVYLDDKDENIRARLFRRGNGYEYLTFDVETMQNIRLFYVEVADGYNWIHLTSWPFNVKSVTSLL